MSTVATLIAPLNYLRIKHPLKRWVDTVPPLFGLLVSGGLLWIKPNFNIFGNSGLVGGIDGLLQSLVGFFITSLAAVATFQGTVFKIDKFFDGDQVLLRNAPLTRRQFLCYLFGYLAFISLVIYLIGVIFTALTSTPHAAVREEIRIACKALFLLPYCALLGHIFGTTLIGLVFLTERLSAVADGDRFRLKNNLSNTSNDPKS